MSSNKDNNSNNSKKSNNLFARLPKEIAKALLLFKALDSKKAIQLTQAVLYLWREFMIKIRITPVIKKFKVEFYYKDTHLERVDVENIDDVINLIEEIKEHNKGEL